MIVELGREQASDPLRRLHLGDGIGRQLGLGAEVVEQLGPHLLRLVEIGETLHHLGVVRLGRERLTEEHDRLAPILEPDLVTLGRVEQEPVLEIVVVFGAELDATAIEIDEPRSVVPLLVERDQVVERPGALGLELESALVRVDRPLRIVEHVATGLADATPEARALLVVVRELGALREHADERGPVREQRRQLVHLVERTSIRLVEGEQPLPRGERLARIVTALVVELRERLEQLALVRCRRSSRSPARRRRRGRPSATSRRRGDRAPRACLRRRDRS